MASPGLRADISPTDFAEALLPFADSAQKCTLFIYDETHKTADAKVDVPLIYDAHAFLEVMHRISPKFAFRRSTVRDGYMVLIRQVGPKWKMDESKYDEWAEVHTNRTMNISRVVLQATQEKRRKPAWAARLPWMTGKCEAADKEIQQEYIYGFDNATKLPFRAPAGKPNKKEFGSWAEDQGTKVKASALAEWSDGDTKPIAGITVGDLADEFPIESIFKQRDTRLVASNIDLGTTKGVKNKSSAIALKRPASAIVRRRPASATAGNKSEGSVKCPDTADGPSETEEVDDEAEVEVEATSEGNAYTEDDDEAQTEGKQAETIEVPAAKRRKELTLTGVQAKQPAAAPAAAAASAAASFRRLFNLRPFKVCPDKSGVVCCVLID